MAITAGALAIYIAFTVMITEWRTHFRRTMNDLDSKANTRAIDSLLNYETVKYFGNEEWEARRYDESLQRWEKAAVKSQTSLSALNIGQSAIIAIAVTLIMWRATVGVVDGTMTHRRPRARQRVHDPALHPAQLPGRDLPRDQAGARGHGAPVRADRGERGDPRQAGRARARRERRRGALRARRLRVRAQPADPVRRVVRDSRGPHGRGGRAVGVGQVDARAPSLPVLRRERRPHHDRRAGHPRRAAGERCAR